jgi:hypothetical protein
LRANFGGWYGKFWGVFGAVDKWLKSVDKCMVSVDKPVDNLVIFEVDVGVFGGRFVENFLGYCPDFYWLVKF